MAPFFVARTRHPGKLSGPCRRLPASEPGFAGWYVLATSCSPAGWLLQNLAQPSRGWQLSPCCV